MDQDEASRVMWRKSSYSNGSGGNCVEVAAGLSGAVVVRDSKDPRGPVLTFSPDRWRAFAAVAKAGAFDLG